MSDLTVEQAREHIDSRVKSMAASCGDQRGGEVILEWIDALIAAAEAKGRAEERERLKPLVAFGRWCLSEMREDGGGDIDGGAAQDKAEALGALIRVPVTGPCGKGCACAEYYGEFPADCLRENPALTHSPETLAAIQAGVDAAREGRVTPMTFVDHVSPTTEEPNA